MHHVKTQLPYALLGGLISIITGDLMSGYLYPDWVGLLITIAAVLAAGYALSAPVHGDRADAVNVLAGKVGAGWRALTGPCCRGAVNSQGSEQGDGEKLRTGGGGANMPAAAGV